MGKRVGTTCCWALFLPLDQQFPVRGPNFPQNIMCQPRFQYSDLQIIFSGQDVAIVLFFPDCLLLESILNLVPLPPAMSFEGAALLPRQLDGRAASGERDGGDFAVGG